MNCVVHDDEHLDCAEVEHARALTCSQFISSAASNAARLVQHCWHLPNHLPTNWQPFHQHALLATVAK
jgi:hypothetical protein